jgi:hypothetical protein
MTAAAFTYVFAIPANNYHWKMEIWNRGGAAWTVDRTGHMGWKWLVEPKGGEAPRQKRVYCACIRSKRSHRAAVDRFDEDTPANRS